MLRANSRIVGCATVTQIGAVVARRAAPAERATRAPSRYGWLPSTTLAPPVSVQRPAGLEAAVGRRVVPGRDRATAGTSARAAARDKRGLGRRGGQSERGQRARDDDQGPSHNVRTVPRMLLRSTCSAPFGPRSRRRGRRRCRSRPRTVELAAVAFHSMNSTSPSKICVGTSQSALGQVFQQLRERRAHAVLAALDARRGDEHGVVGVVGDDAVDVARDQHLGVVREDLLRCPCHDCLLGE